MAVVDVDPSVHADIPKFLTNHTIYYSWEGNPVNISCDVMSNPPATMLWKRERFTISAEPTTNTRVHTAPGKSVLEVGPVQPRDSVAEKIQSSEQCVSLSAVIVFNLLSTRSFFSWP